MTKKLTQGLTVKKDENFSEWYQQLILKSGLADYSSVSGCIVYRPLAYAIWEKIREECDKEFKKIGVQNCYFPLFIPEKSFEQEAQHVEGFTPEVAWVTCAGNTKLNERLAVRPTSEAIMYESYSKWIRSYKELPLLLNQWNNVVRWEFNNPVPFFRGREFLWNEMHTVFATEKEAIAHGKKVMKIYSKITQEFMALPGIYGRKTEKEKFAGAVFSEKMHHYLPNGRVIEGTCFHYDGQNFAKAYNIKFKDKNENEEFVYQNTHAISTRMLGTMFAMHGDDKGLIIPPKLADNKVVIIPILFAETKKRVIDESKKIFKILKRYSPILDEREDYSAGWKYNEWELKGVPLRIEIGPKELERKEVIVVKRTGDKKNIKIENIKKEIPKMLSEIQQELFDSAQKKLYENITETDKKLELINLIQGKKMVNVPLCSNKECEEILKSETGGAKVLFIDSNRKSISEKCIMCGKKADYWVYIGKSY